MNNLQAKTASLSRIETELKTAYQIQMSLVPGQGKAKQHFAGFDVAAALKPARSVGGDIYQFQQVDDQLVFMLGDVSDKGVSAALFMVKVASLFQRLAVQANMTPELILAELNQGLCENNVFIPGNCTYSHHLKHYYIHLTKFYHLKEKLYQNLVVGKHS